MSFTASRRRGARPIDSARRQQEFVLRWELLVGIVAASLLVWAAFGLIRRGLLGWFRHPLGAIFLFLVGLVSLCCQMLPYLGLIALLAGIVLAG